MGAKPGQRFGGRTAGVPNKATIVKQMRAKAGLTEALESGVSPLDVILARMRGEKLPNGKPPSDRQFAAAIAAAPYLHPRLASTDTTIKSDNVHRVVSERPITAEEWLAKHAPEAEAVIVEDGRAV